ncbi:hypothetical protein [Phaeacidiphilus oryzae]|uniref:hypothetical protein n=1 Tax=Phaeacidiphilus oryzae TaxID=348818 RepID=UPI0005630538|nr:hypothetical protein [Phaeacidiphilus oryzae]
MERLTTDGLVLLLHRAACAPLDLEAGLRLRGAPLFMGPTDDMGGPPPRFPRWIVEHDPVGRAIPPHPRSSHWRIRATPDGALRATPLSAPAADAFQAELAQYAADRLLAPGWLLTGHDLAVEGPTEVLGGRRAWRATASADFPPDRLDLLLDAELGILLRLDRYRTDEPVPYETGAITSLDLDVDLAPEPAPPAPAGVPPTTGPPSGPGPAAMPAWMLASGVGRAVRNLLGGHRPHERWTGHRGEARSAAPEEPDGEPWFDPAEDALPPLTGGVPSEDALPGMLYRAGRGAHRLTATAHLWTDERPGEAEFAEEPPMPPGLRPDVERILAALPGRGHRVLRLRIADRTRYRLDLLTAPGPEAGPDLEAGPAAGPAAEPETEPDAAACDGERYYRLGGGRLLVMPALPLTDLRLRPLLDPSWLLAEHRCAPLGWVSFGGRRTLRLTASPGPRDPGGEEIEALLDPELGVLLRLTARTTPDGEPAYRYELREAAPLPAEEAREAEDFRITAPPGTRTVELPAPGPAPAPVEALAEAATWAVGGAVVLARLLRRRPGPRPPAEG